MIHLQNTRFDEPYSMTLVVHGEHSVLVERQKLLIGIPMPEQVGWIIFQSAQEQKDTRSLSCMQVSPGLRIHAE